MRAWMMIALLATGAVRALADDEALLAKENFKGPVCYIAGNVKTVDPAEEKSFAGTIRLRFEAGDLETCQLAVEAHCRNKWAKIGYVVDKIEGYFRREASGRKLAEFTVQKNCTIVSGVGAKASPSPSPAKL
jgi:hypothetical protein